MHLSLKLSGAQAMRVGLGLMMLAFGSVSPPVLVAQPPPLPATAETDRLPGSLGQDSRGLGSYDPARGNSAGQAFELPNDLAAEAGAVDASLHAIVALSEDRLCAVGDRGVILRSDNAGRKWTHVSIPTTINLYAIEQLDESTLIAAGGWLGNYSGTSHGGVLRSTDGGLSWAVLETSQLPRLTGLAVAGERLIGWGDHSPELGTCVFESFDLGNSWRGIDMDLAHATAAAPSPTGEVLAVDELGRMAASRSGNRSAEVRRWIAQPDSPLRSILHAGDRWLAVGEGGEFIASRDGQGWENIDLPLSETARELCGWTSICQQEKHVWVCGRPGSILLHSANGGKTWQRRSTGQTQPLSDIVFVDRNRGWAVGVQGLILATRDGGESWYAQRQGDKRLGLLAVSNRQQQTPWSPLVATAWDLPASASSLVFGQLEPIELADYCPNRASRMAAIGPQLGIVEHRTHWTESWSRDRLIRGLAVELLTLRPQVLLSSTISERGVVAERNAVGELPVTEAVAVAQDPQQLTEIKQELELMSWGVSKVVAVSDEETAHYLQTSGHILRTPGVAIWDLLLPLPADELARSDSVPMRTMWAKSQAQTVRTGLMDGVAHPADIGRELPSGEQAYRLGSYQLLMGRVHRQRSLSRFLPVQGDNPDRRQWLADLEFLLQSFPQREKAPCLVQLVRQLQASETPERAEWLLNNWEDLSDAEDAAEWAALQSLRLAASEEYRAWMRNRSGPELARADTVQLAGGETTAMPDSSGTRRRQSTVSAVWQTSPFASEIEEPSEPNPVMPASASSAGSPRSSTDLVEPVAETRPEGSNTEREEDTHTDSHWHDHLEQTLRRYPRLHTLPDVRLILASQGRRPQTPDGISELLEPLSGSLGMIGWPQAAQQEIQLERTRRDSAKKAEFRHRVKARFATSPPLLDGQLDDACWQGGSRMRLERLEDAPANDTAQVRFAFDQQYLYVAIHCPRDGRQRIADVAEQRGYDADVSQLEHVRLLLDVDRDYNTAVELGVAENGLTFDRCCDIVAYNPKWHVITNPQPGYWIAEVAVPFSWLTPDSSLEGKTWAVSVRRASDGRYTESWSRLKTHVPLLQGNGLLHFAPQRMGP